MKNILILEDNKELLNGLAAIVKKNCEDANIFRASSLESAYRYAMEHTIHLFFLDIVLDTDVVGDVSGLRFARKIRELSQYYITPIVFVTSVSNIMKHAFQEVHCYDYIVKPIAEQQVKEILKKTMQFVKKDLQDKWVDFRMKGVVYPIHLSEIVFMETRGRTLFIHTTRSVYEFPFITLNRALEEAGSDMLIRCHRGAAVNRNYIRSVDSASGYIELTEKYGMVEIGTSYRKRIKKEILS